MSAAAEVLTEDQASRRKWLILVTATFVTMLYAMAVTIASIALPDMRGAMAATQDQITWTITGNLVATAVATPLAGWLAGRLESRLILVVSVLGFVITTVLCGMSQSLEQIVLARIAQGLFGAPLVPISQALVLGAFPAHQRSMAMAAWGMGVIMGPILAPTLGGYFGEHYGWRWVFFIMVPFGVLAMGAVAAFIPRKRPEGGRPFDWIGFLALSAGVAALQLAFRPRRAQRLVRQHGDDNRGLRRGAGLLPFYCAVPDRQTAVSQSGDNA